MLEEIEKLKEDVDFLPFLAKEFNAVEFASNLIHKDQQSVGGSGVDAYLEKVNTFIDQVDSGIQTIIRSNQKQLLERVKKVSRLQTSLDNGARGLDSLMSGVSDIRRDVISPFYKIKECTKRLRNMQLTCDLLRSVLRFLFALKKVQTQMASIKSDKSGSSNLREVAKVATNLAEAEGILMDTRLRGIHVIDEKRVYVNAVGQEIRASTSKILNASILSMNQSEIGNALLVFYNLNCLPEGVDTSLMYISGRLSSIARSALDHNTISQSLPPDSLVKGKDPAQSPAWRAALWNRLDSLLEAIVSCSLQVWTMYRVLCKKKDSISHTRYIDVVVKDKGDLISYFWTQMTQQLAAQMEKGSESSPPVKAVLVGEYPKLRSKLLLVLNRLYKSTSSVSREKDIVIMGASREERDSLLRTVAQFMEAFLMRSLARMNEPVIAMFPSNSDELAPRLPIARDVLKFVGTITTELQSAEGDGHLTSLVAKAAVKSVQLFASKIENAAITDATAFDLSGARSNAQKHNVALLTLLEQLRVAILKLTSPDGSSSIVKNPTDLEAITAILKSSVDVIINLSRDILTPYIGGIAKRCEMIIAKMHHENHTRGGSASIYLSELEKEVESLMAEHLSKITSCPARDKLYSLLANRLVSFFVRHAALLRPLSEEGKLKLAQDISTVEMIAMNISNESKALPPPYKELKALKHLIFADISSVVDNELLVDLRPSTVFHHLLSRAPIELQSPHQFNSITPEEYSRWIDAQTGGGSFNVTTDFLSIGTFQSEEAIWMRVRSCLDAYAQRASTSRDVSSTEKRHAIFYLLVNGGAHLLARFRARIQNQSGEGRV